MICSVNIRFILFAIRNLDKKRGLSSPNNLQVGSPKGTLTGSDPVYWRIPDWWVVQFVLTVLTKSGHYLKEPEYLFNLELIVPLPTTPFRSDLSQRVYDVTVFHSKWESYRKLEVEHPLNHPLSSRFSLYPLKIIIDLEFVPLQIFV